VITSHSDARLEPVDLLAQQRRRKAAQDELGGPSLLGDTGMISGA
jgi:hypothetical protein